MPNPLMPMPSGIEPDLVTDVASVQDLSKHVIKTLSLEQPHLRLTQVIFMDQTDSHNELVQEREWLLHTSEKELVLAGNLFVIDDYFSESGWILVKKAPLSHSRVIRSPGDLRVIPRKESGFDFQMLEDDTAKAPAWEVLTFAGGIPGRTRVLHDWQHSHRPATQTHAMPFILCNTWGDRSRDSRICRDFILEEIDAAARLGVEVVQIDDGWQRGVTANSAQAKELGGLWSGFWNADPDFWEPHPKRFPDGLGPVVARAREKKVCIGLWFAPDAWNHMAHWRKDADCILRLHRTHGIAHFKIDSLVIGSPEAAENLDRFFSAIREESNGAIVLDLDITAQQRPGYFGAMAVGPLFVENRYTDWHNYWPHQTLRNFWKLAHWIDPRRLRMEFLNVSRNTGLYADDPLAPSCYAPDTLLAATLFCNPLGWFEASNLPEAYFEKLPPLVALWKTVRERLFSSAILPIGSAPDGLAHTGFLAHDPTNRRGYVMLFRELNPAEQMVVRLPGVNAHEYGWKVMAGNGSLSTHGTMLSATLPDKLGYLFAAFEPL